MLSNIFRSIYHKQNAFTSHQSSKRIYSLAKTKKSIPPPKESFDWDSIGFEQTRTDFMYISETSKDVDFSKGELRPYGPLQLEPSSTVLNYSQGLFEGLKAQRTARDNVIIFRPTENSKRLNMSGKKLLMPRVSEELFMEAITEVVTNNGRWIPPLDRGALYLRPLVFGSGAGLGVGPSSTYTFIVWCSPVGNYFKGKLGGVNLVVTEEYHRASRLGSGGIKAISNYAPVFEAQHRAKEGGYGEALFLDSKHDKYVEEAGASNVFVVMEDNTILTPELGSILPGITRSSIIVLGREMGYKVEEVKLDIETAMNAKEAFCVGTGASVSPVASITYKGRKAEFGNGMGKITSQLRKALLDIQTEKVKDTHNWLYYPFGFVN